MVFIIGETVERNGLYLDKYTGDGMKVGLGAYLFSNE